MDSIILTLLFCATFLPMAVRNLVYGRHTAAGKLGLLKPRRLLGTDLLALATFGFVVPYALGALLHGAGASFSATSLVVMLAGGLNGWLVGRGTPRVSGPEFEMRDGSGHSLEVENQMSTAQTSNAAD